MGREKKQDYEINRVDPIIIDEANGLIFSTEDELYAHFSSSIELLEQEFFKRRSKRRDIPVSNFEEYEGLLQRLLENPKEIWKTHHSVAGQPICAYLGEFTFAKATVYYVALVYMTQETPSFVYLHFPTKDRDLFECYRHGVQLYSEHGEKNLQEVQLGATEGDALSEGDSLAIGLYKAMLIVRSEEDINESEFSEYADLREETIEEADEIWRKPDLQGNVLVTFIKEFSDSGSQEDLFYFVITLEDLPSSSHALLFSFPSRDKNLVDRYRQGENLQAEEVIQEASH